MEHRQAVDKRVMKNGNAVYSEIFNHCINWEESTVVKKEKRTKERRIKESIHVDSGEAGVTNWTRGTPSAQCRTSWSKTCEHAYVHLLSHWSSIDQWVTIGNSQWCLICVLHVPEETCDAWNVALSIIFRKVLLSIVINMTIVLQLERYITNMSNNLHVFIFKRLS